MSSELISAIFSGMSVLVTAIGGIVVLRRRKLEDDEKQDLLELRYRRRESAALKDYNLAATRHMYRLELLLANKGIEPPARPAELAEDPDLPDRPIRTQPLPPSGGSGRVVEGTLVNEE